MKPLSSLLYFGVAASGSANVHFAFIHLCLQFYLDCRLLFLFAKLRFNFLQEAFLLSPRLILLLSSTWRVLTHCPAGKIEFILQGSNENFATFVLKKIKIKIFPISYSSCQQPGLPFHSFLFLNAGQPMSSSNTVLQILVTHVVAPVHPLSEAFLVTSDV